MLGWRVFSIFLKNTRSIIVDITHCPLHGADNTITPIRPGADGSVVSTLSAGMPVALFTTLVGSVYNVWLIVAYQILAMGIIFRQQI